MRVEVVYEVDEFKQFLEIVKDKSYWIREMHVGVFGAKEGELDSVVSSEGGEKDERVEIPAKNWNYIALKDDGIIIGWRKDVPFDKVVMIVKRIQTELLPTFTEG